MRCPRGRAGSSPASGTTTAPTARRSWAPSRAAAASGLPLRAGGDAVRLAACGLGAAEVAGAVHAQRIGRAVDAGRRPGRHDHQIVLLQPLVLAQEVVDL